MDDVLPSLVALLFGVVALATTSRTVTRRERPLLALSFVAHLGGSFLQVWITKFVYGYGDMLTYFWHGRELAALMRFEPGRWIPEVFALVVKASPELPVYIHGAGGPTGAMTGIVAFLAFFTGDSLYASCLLLGVGSFLGGAG